MGLQGLINTICSRVRACHTFRRVSQLPSTAFDGSRSSAVSSRSIADYEVFLPNDEIWRYDIESGEWETHEMRGEIPPSMSGMCGSSLNGEMYVFGGCNEDGHTNQLYHVNLLNGEYTWRKVVNSIGASPTPRDKLSCWIYEKRLVYFGGYGHKHLEQLDNPGSFVVDEASWVEEVFWGWNNEVHSFNPSTASWFEPLTHGIPPAPRAAHAAATLGSKGFVCGGRVMETRMCDIHCLNLETWIWTEIPMSLIPVGRSWHTLTAVSDSSLFLFGGLSADCAPLSDGWILDIQSMLWREVEHPHRDKPRLWHTASLGKDADVIVFGGSHDDILSVDKGHCNDALVFQTQPYSLLRSCEDYIGSSPVTLQDQLLWLPQKLRRSVLKRISFFKSSAKSREIKHAT